MFSVVASSKVEPLDTYSWKNDVPMTPNLLKDSPPSSPTTPLLSGDVVKPLNGFTALKLGYPFKGSLKKPPQRAYVAPSFQDNESMKANILDVGEPQRAYVAPSFQDNESMKASILDVGEPDRIQPEKRSIKWLDNHGKELIEVKEFEPSECEESDDEQEYCVCAIQ